MEKKIIIVAVAVILVLTAVPIGGLHWFGSIFYTSGGDGTCSVRGSSPGFVGTAVISEKNAFGDTVTAIGDDAFRFRCDLTGVVIPPTVTSIGSYAFLGCNSLKTVEIPSSVITLEEGAFSNCYGLESVTFASGTSIKSIGTGAFCTCIGLTIIRIPSTVTSIGEGAFNACQSLERIYYCGDMDAWERIIIHESNDALISNTLYCYSEAEPTVMGNFWHYSPDGDAVAWGE